MIRCSKRKFERRLAAGGQHNKRPFYAFVKKTKSQTSDGPLIDKDNNKVTSDKEMAKVLNNFFCSVFAKDQGKQHASMAPDSVIGEQKITTTI